MVRTAVWVKIEQVANRERKRSVHNPRSNGRAVDRKALESSDEDFASTFEASLQPEHFEKGQTIEGTIVAISLEVAFVNVGGKGEAMIDCRTEER
jgi:hypothetical protein